MVCGEKLQASHWRSSNELSQSRGFIENFQILEQAHQQIAWVHELSALPNLGIVDHQWGRLGTALNAMSVHEEVASLLYNQFAAAERGLITSIVSEEVHRYEETNAVGTRFPRLLQPLESDAPILPLGNFSPLISLIQNQMILRALIPRKTMARKLIMKMPRSDLAICCP